MLLFKPIALLSVDKYYKINLSKLSDEKKVAIFYNKP